MDGCFTDTLNTKLGRLLVTDTLNTKLGRLLVTETMTPDRLTHLGASRLRTFARRRGVAVTRAKADQVVEAARSAFRLPATRADALLEVLQVDVGLIDALETTIRDTEANLAELLPATPAGILSCRARTTSAESA